MTPTVRQARGQGLAAVIHALIPIPSTCAASWAECGVGAEISGETVARLCEEETLSRRGLRVNGSRRIIARSPSGSPADGSSAIPAPVI